jgi:uncharacterized membrane protein YccC
VKLWDELRGWVTAKSAALRLCFRMTVAGIMAYALAEMLALPQGYWAVFSSIIIVQASVGGSVKATIDRLIGTTAARSQVRSSLMSCRIRTC